MSNLFTHCENILFWGLDQPFNLLSSTGFWLAAWWLYRQHRPAPWSYQFWLIAGVELIGWASLYWHYTHSSLGVALDVGSVVLWLAAYGSYVLHHKYQWSYVRAILAVIIFLGVSWSLGRFLNPWLPQTSGAFISIIMLLGIAGWQKRNRWWLYSSAALTLATLLRVLDLPLCSHVPIGTHSLWHLGCAFSLYAAMKAVLKPR